VLIHSVYFWFKPDADAQRVAEFEAGLRKLSTVPQLKQAHFGRPENTPPRDAIDASYAWGLITVFDSVADHDAYQVHPLHAEFVERFRSTWARVQVYDTRV
jgi:hypothetical protein